jgi:hypothetical protein
MSRSASRSAVGCAPARAEPHVERRDSVIYTKHGRQTMNETITGFVGLDVHAESSAIGVA